ncbi:MAG: putative rane protein, partial [Thermoleophilia bacterium]|nr:putative rane protein [Thermoleophilia bacterium]
MTVALALKLYFTALAIFVVLDMIWLTVVANSLYKR